MVLEMKNRIILSEKQFLILKSLFRNPYMNVLVRKTCVSFSHISLVIAYFQSVGLVEKRYSNSKRIRVLLTVKGRKILDLYLAIAQIMREE